MKTMKASLSTIDRLIKQYGLRPAVRRDLCLFTVSCIADGYTNQLRTQTGISYDALGALGEHGTMHSMLNENNIVQQTKSIIQCPGALEKHFFGPIKKEFNSIKRNCASWEQLARKEPMTFFNEALSLFPRYMFCLGVYNCLWRTIGNGEDTSLSKKQLIVIGKERSRIAVLYPNLEQLLQKATTRIGRKLGFDGDLLRYATRAELKEHGTFLLAASEQRTLRQRRKHYFYLYEETKDREYIVSDAQVVRAIQKRYFAPKQSTDAIKGFAAFNGNITGTVYNALSKTSKRQAFPKNMILVTDMTHPSDIALIKQARAIITDEGGILSHAAIIARELKIPCLIGTGNASSILKTGDKISVGTRLSIIKRL